MSTLATFHCVVLKADVFSEELKRGSLGTILDPTLTGLQPTVAGLGLGVLNPTVAGLKSTVDVAKRDV